MNQPWDKAFAELFQQARSARPIVMVEHMLVSIDEVELFDKAHGYIVQYY